MAGVLPGKSEFSTLDLRQIMSEVSTVIGSYARQSVGFQAIHVLANVATSDTAMSGSLDPGLVRAARGDGHEAGAIAAPLQTGSSRHYRPAAVAARLANADCGRRGRQQSTSVFSW